MRLSTKQFLKKKLLALLDEFEQDSSVKVESASHFRQLMHNSILETFISLYQEEMDKVMDS